MFDRNNNAIRNKKNQLLIYLHRFFNMLIFEIKLFLTLKKV